MSAQVIEIASVGTGMATMHAVRWLPGTARFFAAGADARGVAALRAYALGGEGERSNATATASGTDLAPRLTLDCTPTYASGPKQGQPCAGLRCATFFRVGGVGGGTTAAAAPATLALAAGALDGGVLAFDPHRPAQPAWQAETESNAAVSAIDALGNPGPPEIATGGLDGCVRVWDVRQRGRPVAAFEPPAVAVVSAAGASSAGPPTVKRRECWAVAFGGATSSQDRLLAAGYDNGDVKVFDLRMAAGLAPASASASSSSSSPLPPPPPVRWELNLGNGVCSLAFDRRDIEPNKLLAGCLEGVMAAVDLRGAGGGKGKKNNAASAATASPPPRPRVHRTHLPPASGLAAELVAERQRASGRGAGAAAAKKKIESGLGAAAAADGEEEEDQEAAAAAGPPPTQQPQQRRRGGATAWAVVPLPQDREVSACTTGDGAVVLHRYSYCGGGEDEGEDGGQQSCRLALAGGAALAPQPLGAWDWSPDKRGLFVCSALDQRLRVGVVTGLN